MDDIKEDAKSYFSKRLNSTLVFYVITSWLLINWSNILYLFMGDGSIEKRIAGIYAEGALWFHYFLVPILCGMSASIVFPFLEIIPHLFKMFASKAVNWIKEREITGDVNVSMAESFIRERKKVELAKIAHKTERMGLNTNLLREHRKLVLKACADVQVELEKLSNDKKMQEKFVRDRQEDCARIIGKGLVVLHHLRDYKENKISIDELTSRMNDSYSGVDFKNALMYLSKFREFEDSDFVWFSKHNYLNPDERD